MNAAFGRRWQGALLAAPLSLWLLLAFALPLMAVVLLSLHPAADPFGALWQAPSLAQFKLLAEDPFYSKIVLQTLGLSVGVTALTLLLGYPLALWLVGLPPRWRALGFAVILIPLLTNVVVRSLGIVLLLAPDGLVNQLLGLLGIAPFRTMLYTPGAVAIALAQVFMPFLVLALYDVLQGISPRVHEAASSLGASPATRFLAVTLPLSLPGLRSGVVIVFLMASTAYVSATLLGGQKVLTVGMLIWQEALQNLNAPLASALALVMALIGALIAFVVHRACRWLMPWTTGRIAASPAALSPGLIRLLDTLGRLFYRLLVGAALLLLLLPHAQMVWRCVGWRLLPGSVFEFTVGRFVGLGGGAGFGPTSGLCTGAVPLSGSPSHCCFLDAAAVDAASGDRCGYAQIAANLQCGAAVFGFDGGACRHHRAICHGAAAIVG